LQWVFFSGSSVHVVADDNNVIQAIFFQDQEMKNMFRAFPEVIFVDSAYRTNNTQMAMYVLLVEDGNGESEIVAVWFLRDETADDAPTASAPALPASVAAMATGCEAESVGPDVAEGSDFATEDGAGATSPSTVSPLVNNDSEPEASSISNDQTSLLPPIASAPALPPSAAAMTTEAEDAATDNGQSTSGTLLNNQSPVRLQLPPAVKKRGRPKGATMTVIGLKRAKRSRKQLVPFTNMDHVQQQTGSYTVFFRVGLMPIKQFRWRISDIFAISAF